VSLLALPSFRPTRFGGDPPKHPFNEAACIERICSREDFDIYFERKPAPAWAGTFGSTRGVIDFSDKVSEEAWPSIFSWSNALADVFLPEYGVCHLVYPEAVIISKDADRGVFHHPGTYRDCGLAWLGARSFLGHSVVALLGKRRLKSTGVILATRPWGVIVDLVENPWEASPELLLQRQNEVMQDLLPTGLFADYSGVLPKPGKKWIPIDID
jgi:hypothetical protein